ncbi:hypothetical protein ACFLIM_33545 [Nonomuraea sp. M3C6]|uniref:Uncharacterized protein n=1 Tax=Nonomuraea marmarensis TaxID=3351344 RepID=A0ABW7AL82_9ACTN
MGVGILAAGVVLTANRWPALSTEHKRWAGVAIPTALFVAYAFT